MCDWTVVVSAVKVDLEARKSDEEFIRVAKTQAEPALAAAAAEPRMTTERCAGISSGARAAAGLRHDRW